MESREGKKEGGIRLKDGIKVRYVKSSTKNGMNNQNKHTKKEGINLVAYCDFILNLQLAAPTDKRSPNEE